MLEDLLKDRGVAKCVLSEGLYHVIKSDLDGLGIESEDLEAWRTYHSHPVYSLPAYKFEGDYFDAFKTLYQSGLCEELVFTIPDSVFEGILSKDEANVHYNLQFANKKFCEEDYVSAILHYHLAARECDGVSRKLCVNQLINAVSKENSKNGGVSPAVFDAYEKYKEEDYSLSDNDFENAIVDILSRYHPELL